MLLLTLFALGILLIDLMLPEAVEAAERLHRADRHRRSRQRGRQAALAYHVAEQQGHWHRRIHRLHGLADGRPLRHLLLLPVSGWAQRSPVLMSVRYLEIEQENHGEFYALMLFSVVGMMCMAAGYDIVLLFIGLELMAISTYVLVGFLRRDKRSNEAALKYLLLGAFSSGIFAYGLSLFYGVTGSTNLGQIAQKLQQNMADAAQRSDRHLRPAGDCHRPAVQDCGGAVPPVGARRLRRRAHQRDRIHVRRGESRGLGDAAAHLPVRPLSRCARCTCRC